MREKGIDYFENSRRATYVQQEYAIRNPLNFKGYGKIENYRSDMLWRLMRACPYLQTGLQWAGFTGGWL